MIAATNMKFSLGYSVGSLLIAIAVLFQGESNLCMAAAIPLVDDRHIGGTCGQGASPTVPFSPFDAVVSGACLGAFGDARQTSIIDISNGSMNGFSGTMEAFGVGRATFGWNSRFGLTFRLQEANYYSSEVGITTGGEFAGWNYILLFAGVLNKNASGSGSSSQHYSNSGILGPGDYQVFYLVDASFGTPDVDITASSDISTNFSFTLTPVPEGGSTIVMMGIGLALMAIAVPVSSTRSKGESRTVTATGSTAPPP
jgi:hypothetical protein